MREILFKAKRKDNGEWVEGYYLNIAKINPFICTGKIKLDGAVKGIIAPEMYEIDPGTICQYVGLTDKNGKKIWENDIVSAWSEGSNAIGKVIRRVDGLYIMYPAYQKKEFWSLCPNKNGETTVKIIGNIFDNVDLLEVE